MSIAELFYATGTVSGFVPEKIRRGVSVGAEKSRIPETLSSGTNFVLPSSVPRRRTSSQTPRTSAVSFSTCIFQFVTTVYLMSLRPLHTIGEGHALLSCKLYVANLYCTHGMHDMLITCEAGAWPQSLLFIWDNFSEMKCWCPDESETALHPYSHRCGIILSCNVMNKITHIYIYIYIYSILYMFSESEKVNFNYQIAICSHVFTEL